MAARRVVFVDLETIKLGPLNRAWEYGLIIRDPGFATDQEKLWFVDLEDLNLAMADPAALAIGRFHTRHEQALAQPDLRQRRLNVARERDVLAWVEWWTRTAVLVGWGVSFDAGLMDERMRAHGISPSWHYRLVDVRPLAIGYLRGLTALDPHRQVALAERIYAAKPAGVGLGELDQAVEYVEDLLAPGVAPGAWPTDVIIAGLGIDPAPAQDRHTALGDARSARAVYDLVTGVVKPTLFGAGAATCPGGC